MLFKKLDASMTLNGALAGMVGIMAGCATVSLFGAMAIGLVSGVLSAFGTGMALFLAIKHTVGLRVTEDEELRGLDIGEHGMEAYNGFQTFTTQ